MAYYAALVSLVQLLEDIIHRDRYPNLLLDKQHIASVHEKFSLLQKLLDDYSPKYREAGDSLERRIRDAAYQVQDIIESHISDKMRQYLSEKNEMPQQLQDIIESEIPNQVHRKDKTHGIKRALPDLISAFKKAPHQLVQLHRKDKTHGIKRALQPLISAFRKVPHKLVQPQRCEELRLDNVSKEYQDLENVKEEVNSILELEEVKEEVDSIVKELMRIKESHTIEDNSQLSYYSAGAGTSNQASGTNTIVGFEERLTTIKDQVCGERSKLQVVSIIGMGGIGKTTLARKIFEDGLMVYKFDCRAWVTVSQDYHQQKVLLDILDSLNVPTDKSSGVGELEEKIYKHLKGKRYLVIMDDMWDKKVWDDMKRMLPDDSNGSRIMITTRISNVALYVDKFGFYYQMEFLNEEQSWNLFCGKVFCPPELEDVGRLIARNCRGLPLAIVVVAGLLAKVKRTRLDWEKIAKNVSSIASENDEHFSNILSLSYNHLPHHLKPCLLYIGGFPEDYEIRVSKLVKLWVAEGFLKPIESKSLEAAAEEYLEDLVNRNLVLITKKGSNGKIKCCGIHDLLRELCTKISSYENFLHVVYKDFWFPPTAATNMRRLFIRGYLFFGSLLDEEQFSPHVRSIISQRADWIFVLQFCPCRSSFKLLRVLESTNENYGFIAKISELFHLRYLCVAIYEIPASISLLQNLETLIIKSGSRSVRSSSLPSEIQDMPNLRHIMSSRKVQFECQFFEERIAGEPFILENLQTLLWVKDVRFTNEVIEMIPNLQKLKVKYSTTRKVWQEFQLENLFHLCQLQTLNIHFRYSWKHKVNPLPENFAFPLTLEKLSLQYCKLPWKDITLLGSLPNLQVLKLRCDAFVGEKWELVDVEFPQLKFLLMECLELKYWQAENTHFPRLQHLKINYCSELDEIPPEIGEISSLELVEVKSSELAARSALKMQQEQQDMGNDFLRVKVHVGSGFWYFRDRWHQHTSDTDEELKEEELESEDEMQEDGSESSEQIQEINPVN